MTRLRGKPQALLGAYGIPFFVNDMYTPTYVHNRTTQTIETQKSIWLQLADFLRAIGQVFVAIGRALIRIGEFIYEVFFQ